MLFDILILYGKVADAPDEAKAESVVVAGGGDSDDPDEAKEDEADETVIVAMDSLLL